MPLQPIVATPASTASPAISDDEANALARTTVNLFKAWMRAAVQKPTTVAAG